MTILILSLMLFGHVALAAGPTHQHGSGETTLASTTSVDTCQPAISSELARKGKPSQEQSGSVLAGFEGVQIETADITLYEIFFETILQAKRVQTMEHPQVDRLRGYCYRNVLIVVRQDLKTVRPTGWVQINFSVPDAALVQQELERASQTSPVSKLSETEQSKIVRIRLKPDVRRGDCRAIRLEVGGPEGFMVGFDQYKEGSCAPGQGEGKP